eukprot:253063-Chlamydomonas_euryale.AAC.1
MRPQHRLPHAFAPLVATLISTPPGHAGAQPPGLPPQRAGSMQAAASTGAGRSNGRSDAAGASVWQGWGVGVKTCVGGGESEVASCCGDQLPRDGEAEHLRLVVRCALELVAAQTQHRHVLESLRWRQHMGCLVGRLVGWLSA